MAPVKNVTRGPPSKKGSVDLSTRINKIAFLALSHVTPFERNVTSTPKMVFVKPAIPMPLSRMVNALSKPYKISALCKTKRPKHVLIAQNMPIIRMANVSTSSQDVRLSTAWCALHVKLVSLCLESAVSDLLTYCTNTKKKIVFHGGTANVSNAMWDTQSIHLARVCL